MSSCAARNDDGARGKRSKRAKRSYLGTGDSCRDDGWMMDGWMDGWMTPKQKHMAQQNNTEQHAHGSGLNMRSQRTGMTSRTPFKKALHCRAVSMFSLKFA